MVTNTNFWSFVVNAGPVVKFVMMMLVTASIISWTIIFQRLFLFKNTFELTRQFEKTFWSGADLNQLFAELKPRAANLFGFENIFYAGFDAFKTMRSQNINTSTMMDNVQRAMHIAHMRERDRLEKHLSFLATVASTSPYVGLFGTVWGIMTTLQALGGDGVATIATVAPGISETLIATAMGLFAAIPAQIAYNRFSNQLDRFSNNNQNFQDEFYNLLQRQTAAAG